MSSPALNTNDSTVLLFGPLSPSLSQSDLAVLRTMIISSPHHAWIERVLISLSVQYPLLATEFPVLFDTAGRPHVDSLVNWLKTGDLDLSTEHLPNSLLAPLVVISQLVQYRTYLENQRTNGGQPQVTEPVGFCIGLLSAFAVSLPHGSKGRYLNRTQRLQCDWRSFLVLWSISSNPTISEALRQPSQSLGSASHMLEIREKT